MSIDCSCGFGMGPDDVGLFSAAWYRLHTAHHLAVYPDVDQCTRDNLAADTERAERLERTS